MDKFKEYIKLNDRSLWYLVLGIVIICGIIGYYIFHYNDHGTGEQIRDTIQQSKSENAKTKDAVRRATDSVRSASKTAGSISDTNTELQRHQRKSAETIQSAADQLRDAQSTAKDLERTLSEAESTTAELDRSFEQLKVLQSDGAKSIDAAESANHSAYDTAHGIREKLNGSQQQFREYEEADREIRNTIQRLREVGQENGTQT